MLNEQRNSNFMQPRVVVGGRSPVLNVMTKAIYAASKRLVRDFGEIEHLQVSQKGPGDFASNSDSHAEKTIHYELSKARPNIGFIMEESGELEGEDPEHRWIVDPLDGTTNFVHGLPHWCISIALEKNGEIVAGAVYDPLLDEMFVAEKGFGAYLNNRRLRVSSRKKLNESMVVTSIRMKGLDSEKSELAIADAKALIPCVASLRSMGAASLDLAYVAAGRFDAALFSRAKIWDLAAGTLLIKEAGGQITDKAGKQGYLESGDIIASNVLLHPELLKVVS